MDIEQAKQVYLEKLPELQQLNDQIKAVRKQIGGAKRVFKKHMKHHKMQRLQVGNITFGFEKKEKVVCTMERVEQSFPPDQVLDFKNKNKQAKEVFTEV